MTDLDTRLRSIVDELTPSQIEAIVIVADREPEPTYTSNRNGASYVHSGSASKLVDLGLAVYQPWRALVFDRLLPTDDGRTVAAALKARP